MVKTQRFRRRKHLVWDRVHFHHPRVGWVAEVRGMSLSDNTIRFLTVSVVLPSHSRMAAIEPRAILVLRRVQ